MTSGNKNWHTHTPTHTHKCSNACENGNENTQIARGLACDSTLGLVNAIHFCFHDPCGSVDSQKVGLRQTWQPYQRMDLVWWFFQMFEWECDWNIHSYWRGLVRNTGPERGPNTPFVDICPCNAIYLRSWDLCPQQQPQSWPCLQWSGSQLITTTWLHMGMFVANCLSALLSNEFGSFLWWLAYTQVVTGTATLAQGLKAFTEEAPTCARESCFKNQKVVEQVVWLVLIAFFLADGFHKPVAQECNICTIMWYYLSVSRPVRSDKSIWGQVWVIALHWTWFVLWVEQRPGLRIEHRKLDVSGYCM